MDHQTGTGQLSQEKVYWLFSPEILTITCRVYVCRWLRARSHWIKIMRFCTRRCSFPCIWQFEHQAMQNRQESHDSQSPGWLRFASFDSETSNSQSRARVFASGWWGRGRGFNPHCGTSNNKSRRREVRKSVVKHCCGTVGFFRQLTWLPVKKPLDAESPRGWPKMIVSPRCKRFDETAQCTIAQFWFSVTRP